MLLVIDIGNSNIVFGVTEQDSWTKTWRIQTAVDNTADEYEVIFRTLLQHGNIPAKNIKKVIISSVVPLLNKTFILLMAKIFDLSPIILSPEIYKKINLKIINPYQIGSDLVANSLAAYWKYPGNNIILDLGTALTLTTVNQKGEICGVSIAPGIETALNSLSSSTAQLPTVEIKMPPSVLGKNTIHAIQSGVLIGYKGMIEYMVGSIKKELQVDKVNVIATGGLSEKIPTTMLGCVTHIEPYLTLEGLKYIAETVN